MVYSSLQLLWASPGSAFVKQLWPTFLSIIRRYSGEGQSFWMNSYGLISFGPGLTWMDVRVDGVPVTLRVGKACEINVLWRKSLKIIESFAHVLKDPWSSRRHLTADHLYDKTSHKFRSATTIKCATSRSQEHDRPLSVCLCQANVQRRSRCSDNRAKNPV
jgi:predicted glycogen debranching enzyme